MNTLTQNNKRYHARDAEMQGMVLAGKRYPSCAGCAFNEETDLCKAAQIKIHCIAEYRDDNRNIIWIEEK